MQKLFGTDGIRGVANMEPMTAEIALALGRAVAYTCKRHRNRHRIIIGKDTRLSGYMIENALTAGICSMGVDVFLVGPIPTPGIAFITRSMRADAGIVISASHNPYHDNGIKIFSREGFKISDELEREIEELISTGRINDIRPTAEEVGKARRIDDAVGRYIEFCKNTFPTDLTLEGLKIVIDCANGATYKIAPIIFSELGAEVCAIHDKPNGTNINDNCGSQYTSDLREKVVETGADMGLAFDGDGDRLIAIDETGTELTGDHILVICAKAMKEENSLKNNLAVITPMSNLGIKKALDEMNIRYIEAAVGDRNVLETMIKEDAALGGEQSGHIIFRSQHTTGDGIISAMQLLAVMQRSGQKLSELAKMVTIFPQKLVNVDVKSKPEINQIPGLPESIRKAEKELGKHGRVFVRYSGTQPICRVMIEGPTGESVERLTENIASIIKREIGS